MNPRLAQRSSAREQVVAEFGGEDSPIENCGRHATRFRPSKEAHLERVRREVRLGFGFSAEDFKRAFAGFRQIYNCDPTLVACSPDVLERYCRLFEGGDPGASARALRYDDVALAAAVLPPGTVAFEGDVDEGRMGDW